MHQKRRFALLAIMTLMINLVACTTLPPKNSNDICGIFQQYNTWYWDAQKTEKRWGVPIYVTIAIVHQESRFSSDAKPPREKLLWVIPWFRPTSSFGYSQAVNSTWRHYQRDTGKSSANRDAFGSAIDFIGWYVTQINKKLGISKSDTYSLYLAYHEGMGGYQRGTYKKKKWLLAVARNVKRQAWTYQMQLAQCQSKLPKKPWWRIW